MYRGKQNRIFPIIIVILIVAIVIAALVSIGRALFGGSSEPQAVDQSQAVLLDVTGGTHVVMSVRGPIVAHENFRSYQVDISPTSRNLTTYSGYAGQRLDSQQLSNNTTAYEEFVYALNRAKFAEGRQLEGEDNDTRGICPTGRLYEFAIMRGDSAVKQLWTTSCGGSRGSFRTNLDQTRTLFLRQLPDSNRLVDRIDL